MLRFSQQRQLWSLYYIKAMSYITDFPFTCVYIVPWKSNACYDILPRTRYDCWTKHAGCVWIAGWLLFCQTRSTN